MADALVAADYLEERDLVEATAADGRPRCRVYRPELAKVVLGRGSRAAAELDLGACRRDGVPVYRRRGGGCAVLLDPGQLVVAVSLSVPGLPGSLEQFRRLSSWLIAALGRLGLGGVRREGPSDLVQGDRKVGGACIHRSRDLVHYATTLLISPEVELMERYLLHPPREPGYRRGRPHREFVGALRPGARLEEVAALQGALQAELGVEAI